MPTSIAHPNPADPDTVRDVNLLLLSLGISALPRFLAEHAGAEPTAVRLGYLDDASLPYAGQHFAVTEFDLLTDAGYVPRRITARDVDSVEAFDAILGELDALYVCGGETFFLLHALRGTDDAPRGLDVVLADRVRTGLPYIGLSAGSVLAGSSIEPISGLDDPTLAPGLTNLRGLGLVDTAVVPHADGILPNYPLELIDRVRTDYGDRFDLTFVNDDQALLVSGSGVSVVPSP
ncbi:MAG: Type 1 glutamine amidotransferase-like domain-containing protein [Gordonia sp. (in: high G+C Gram-positive bacteria)]